MLLFLFFSWNERVLLALFTKYNLHARPLTHRINVFVVHFQIRNEFSVACIFVYFIVQLFQTSAFFFHLHTHTLPSTTHSHVHTFSYYYCYYYNLLIFIFFMYIGCFIYFFSNFTRIEDTFEVTWKIWNKNEKEIPNKKPSDINSIESIKNIYI